MSNGADELEELQRRAMAAGYFLMPMDEYIPDNGASRMLGVVLFGMFTFGLGIGVAALWLH